MIKLFVLPEDIYDILQEEGKPLTLLLCADEINQMLSANDIADIDIAMEEFPFATVLKECGVEMGDTPMKTLILDQHFSTLTRRVSERLANYQLMKAANPAKGIPLYSLVVVNGTLWVAVLQRQRHEEGNLDTTVISVNHPFFDSLMATVLQTKSFESACSTKLFSHYLTSLPTTKVA